MNRGRGHHILQDPSLEAAADVSMDTLASSKGLSWETRAMLKQQGIASLEMLRSLTPDDIALLTQGSGFLPQKQLDMLKMLVRELQTSVEVTQKDRRDVRLCEEGLEKCTLSTYLHQYLREEVIPPQQGLCQLKKDLVTCTNLQPTYNPMLERTQITKSSTAHPTTDFSKRHNKRMNRGRGHHILQDPSLEAAAGVLEPDDVSMDILASSKGLSWETRAMLKQQGIDSLEMLRSLTPDDIALLTQGSGFLPQKQLDMLKMLVRELQTSMEGTQKDRRDVRLCEETEPRYFDSSTFSFRDSSDDKTLRFLLIGKTGSGKSTTGNTIIGKSIFRNEVGFCPITSECRLEKSVYKGVCIEIVDSPGLCDSKRSVEDVSSEVVRFVLSMHPGPTAILYVIEIRRYTEEDEGVFNRVKSLFDERVTEYIIIIFTRGDELRHENKKICEALASAPESLHKVLNKCGNRYVVFDNMAEDKQPQVDRLLQEVRKLSEMHDGIPYSCPKYDKASEKFEQELKRRLQKVEEDEVKIKASVKELEEKTKRIQEKAKKEMRDLERKEKEMERKMRKEEEEKQKTFADMPNSIKELRLNDKKDLQIEKQLHDRMKEELNQKRKKMEEENKILRKMIIRNFEERERLLKEKELALEQERLKHVKMHDEGLWQLKKEVANSEAKQAARCSVM